MGRVRDLHCRHRLIGRRGPEGLETNLYPPLLALYITFLINMIRKSDDLKLRHAVGTGLDLIAVIQCWRGNRRRTVNLRFPTALQILVRAAQFSWRVRECAPVSVSAATMGLVEGAQFGPVVAVGHV